MSKKVLTDLRFNKPMEREIKRLNTVIVEKCMEKTQKMKKRKEKKIWM